MHRGQELFSLPRGSVGQIPNPLIKPRQNLLDLLDGVFQVFKIIFAIFRIAKEKPALGGQQFGRFFGLSDNRLAQRDEFHEFASRHMMLSALVFAVLNFPHEPRMDLVCLAPVGGADADGRDHKPLGDAANPWLRPIVVWREILFRRQIHIKSHINSPKF
jgi:hypothetical protein